MCMLSLSHLLHIVYIIHTWLQLNIYSHFWDFPIVKTVNWVMIKRKNITYVAVKVIGESRFLISLYVYRSLSTVFHKLRGVYSSSLS